MDNKYIGNNSIDGGLRCVYEGEFSDVENLIISTPTKDLACMDYVHLNTNKEIDLVELFKANEELKRNIPEWEAERNFCKRLALLCGKVVPEEREAFRKKTRYDVVIEQLNNMPAYRVEAKVISDEEIKYIQIEFSGDRDDDGKLRGCIASISKLNESRIKEMKYNEVVNKIINIQEDELRQKNLQLDKTNEQIVSLLGNIVERRDETSGQHINRVKRYTYVLGMQVMNDYPEYKLTESKVNTITYVSPLHDIGKITIPDSILLKPGKLTEDEWKVMKTHCESGCEILEPMAGAWHEDYMNTSIEICKYHHEKWDGKGCPMGLSGDQIPISAQIVSVADCFDALTSKRVYKDAVDVNTAIRMILNGECGEFSDKIKNCLIKCRDKLAMAMASSAEFYVISDRLPKVINKIGKMFRNMSVLLVDNDDVSREVSKTILELEGAIVLEARSSYEAADIVENTDWFDMIIMDLVMPGMSALETIRTIRQMPRVVETDIPIVVVNEQVTDEIIEQVIEAGGLGCIRKPLLISELYGVFLSSLKDKTTQIEKRLKDTIKLINIDCLTKVKNITAYTDKVEDLANDILKDRFTEFAIVLCDVNDLKKENDSFGHDIGDIYLKNCCKVICDVFAHSPVFRIGGDEFAVVLHSTDYQERESLMMKMEETVDVLSKIPSSEMGKAAFVSGMAVYDPVNDKTVGDVIRRADAEMYENKKRMKVGEFGE